MLRWVLGHIRRAAVGPVLACVATGVAAASPAAPGAEAVFGPHSLDLGSGSPSAVCNFCHTPQGRRGGAPGWESGQPEPEFQSYDTRRAGGSIDMRGNVSIACLSCHDGSQAPDAAANMPYVVASLGPRDMPGSMALEHPVGIVFSGYLAPDLSGPIPGNRLQREVVGGEVRWWLDMEAAPDGVRDKTDVILYTRDRGAGPQPFIECASCHDPHASPRSNFLRAPAARSNLCQACHNL